MKALKLAIRITVSLIIIGFLLMMLYEAVLGPGTPGEYGTATQKELIISFFIALPIGLIFLVLTWLFTRNKVKK